MAVSTSTVKCCYLDCDNSYRSHYGLKMFRFPKENYQEWVKNCGNPILVGELPEKLYKNKKVCEVHFRPEDILSNGRLMKGAVPIPFDHSASDLEDSPPPSPQRLGTPLPYPCQVSCKPIGSGTKNSFVADDDRLIKINV